MDHRRPSCRELLVGIAFAACATFIVAMLVVLLNDESDMLAIDDNDGLQRRKLFLGAFHSTSHFAIG